MIEVQDSSGVVVPPTPQAVMLLQRLGYLEEALLTKDPAMKGHIGEIHKLLIGYEELVHLLSNEEIAVLMTAQQIQTNTSLIANTTTTKAKASSAAKTAKLSLGDL